MSEKTVFLYMNDGTPFGYSEQRSSDDQVEVTLDDQRFLDLQKRLEGSGDRVAVEAARRSWYAEHYDPKAAEIIREARVAGVAPDFTALDQLVADMKTNIHPYPEED